mmetsp:Transcript_9368/g.22250  ORF Transcript_9368/g.22250 Transcript_9368/m.22250 type:complete len:113 (+) Transcript_9368:300-638(+)
MLAGLAVDATAHLAISYLESHSETRADKVRDAFTEMGVTVLGGALTSMGAAAALFLCFMQFFFKFGGALFMLMASSITFALFFFMTMLAICGPVGKWGRALKWRDVRSLCRR